LIIPKVTAGLLAANLLLRIKITYQLQNSETVSLEEIMNDNFLRIYDYSNLSLISLGVVMTGGLKIFKKI